MNKYIVKNCPAITGDECNSFRVDENEIYCQDCTDCLIKQVIEKCKEHPFCDCACGDEILQLFDIEEVE